MPLAITLGFKSKGRDAEPSVLYAGLDAGKAAEIANAPGPEFVRAEYFKAPAVTFRRYFEPAAPVAEAPAPEAPAEEPAPPVSSRKK